MDSSTIIIINGVAAIFGTGVVGALIKGYIRLGILETLFAEKKETINTVKILQEAMEKRLVEVEIAIASLNTVLPDLRKLGETAQRLEILMAETNRNIERLEKAVFDNQHK